MTTTLQVDIGLVLHTLDDEDQCIDRLTTRLQQIRGIEQAHVVREDGNAKLCLHYDPDLLTLARVERIATQEGAAFSTRYRHDSIAFLGLGAADTADVIAQEIARLPGVLHATANYAAGLFSVAYDSEILQRPQIEQRIRSMGARLPMASSASPATVSEEYTDEHDGHEHGSAPEFLPHWMQERWPLLLVGLAGSLLLIGWVGETFAGLPANIALVLYILAMLAGGYDVATHALPGLLRGKFDTDVLMLAAALGAALLGQWLEGAFLLFLFALGHAGEQYALDRARNAVNALGQLMPKTARVRRVEQIIEVPVSEVLLGDLVVVRPGDSIPVDGTIVSGSSSIDQSPVTGESVPVQKTIGAEVFAGTINHDAALDVQVTRLTKDNTLSRIMQLVSEAQSQQSLTQQLTQRFTAWFVPAVLILTLLVIVVPPLLGWMPLRDSFYRAMLLLVAASPCALAIGTPATVLAGIAQAARNGVLIKGGVHLENLGGLAAMAFDKTGTLTEGTFQVVEVVPQAGVEADELLSIAAAVEQQSNHPLAQAVLRAAAERNLSIPQATGLENAPGKGVRSSVADQPILIGTLTLFAEAGYLIEASIEDVIEGLEQRGQSTMVVGRSGQFLGVLSLADKLRANAPETMQRLRALGIQHLVMLTGDNQAVAERIAGEVGLTDVRAQLLPEQKLDVIKQLQTAYGPIAMTGDGVNDAPALATATVGIAMGGAGTAVALETADVALMADDIGKLPFAVGLSRAAHRIIRQNLAISLGVIGLLLITSVIGLVQLSGAVVLHEGSTIVVVLNALRLLGYREPKG